LATIRDCQASGPIKPFRSAARIILHRMLWQLFIMNWTESI